MEHIATSRAYQSQPVPLAKEIGGEEYVFRGPELKRLTAEQFIDAVWHADRHRRRRSRPRRRRSRRSPDATPTERQFVRASLRGLPTR